VLDPNVLAPQAIRHHRDGNKCDKHPAKGDIGTLSLAVVGGTMADAIYCGEEREDLHPCFQHVSCEINVPVVLELILTI